MDKRGSPYPPQSGVNWAKALPDILATRTGVLSPRLIHAIEGLTTDWRRFDERVEEVTAEIEALATTSASQQAAIAYQQARPHRQDGAPYSP